MDRKNTLKIITYVCAVVLLTAVALGIGQIFRGAGYAQAGNYTVGDAEITGAVRNLDIDWTSGQIRIAYHSANTVTLTERSNEKLSEDQRMRWWLDGDTLRVQYEKPGFHPFSFHSPVKELTVTLPEGTALTSAKISATSADLDIPALEADTMTLDLTSGDIRAAAKTRKLRVDATSGSIALQVEAGAEEISVGSTSGVVTLTAPGAGKVRIGTTSGRVTAALGDVAQTDISSTSGAVQVSAARLGSLKVGTTSGNVSAALPADPGFTARLSTTSGSADYTLPLEKRGDAYVCGDGSGEVRISTTSGSIRVTPAAE